MADAELEQRLWQLLQKFADGQGDPGAVSKVTVDHPEGDAAAAADSDGRFVSVWARNVFNDKARTLARLFSPGGMLWWLPEAGEVALTLRPADLGGSLVSWLLHGVGGADGRVPSWLSSSRMGLWARAGKFLRIEAEDKDVEVNAPSGKVKLQNGGKGVARKGHQVDIGTFSLTMLTVGSNNFVVDVLWTPPGGGTPVSLITTPNGKGSISQGSTKVEIDSSAS